MVGQSIKQRGGHFWVAKHKEEQRQEKAHEDRRLVNATIWLAVVTTALAIFTAFLWSSTRRLVIEAKETSKRQLRAYVFFKPYLPISIPTLEEWHTNGMRFMVHNNGQTPAYDLKHTTHIGIRERNIEVALDPVTVDDAGSKLVLNPGLHTEQTIKFDAPLSQANKERLKTKTHSIYVWGEARYRDTFGTQQWCKYAFQIDGEGTASGNIHWCANGNEAS